MNAAAARLVDAHDFEPEHWRRSAAHLVRMGEPNHTPPPGRWAGHVVIRCEGLLIDASIDQVHDPRKGLVLEGPVVLPVGDGFRRDGDVAGFLMAEGGAVAYIHRPGNEAFRAFPGWRPSPRLLEMARQALDEGPAAASSVRPPPGATRGRE